MGDTSESLRAGICANPCVADGCHEKLLLARLNAALVFSLFHVDKVYASAGPQWVL
eukprot:SAG31_NODE_1127_length_9758_cov_2.771301_5_plen_56_part_00